MTSSPMLPASIVTLGAMLCGMLPSPIDADDWPQWRGPQRDGVWRETGIVGRVYVTDRQVDPQQTERGDRRQFGRDESRD